MSVQNFSFLARLEVAEKFVVGWGGGGPGQVQGSALVKLNNRAISVQLNLTGTANGTELGNKIIARIHDTLTNITIAAATCPRNPD